jgi:hypothetical protein
MKHTCISSPFNCLWIDKGSDTTLDSTSYAICRRSQDPRVVSEGECATCPLWREPEDAAGQRGRGCDA